MKKLREGFVKRVFFYFISFFGMFGDGRRKKNKDKPKTISMKASGNQEILKF